MMKNEINFFINYNGLMHKLKIKIEKNWFEETLTD